jgi:hypothetical protein
MFENNPDRRIFKIDVSNLPNEKAEAFIKKLMEEYRKNKDQYKPNEDEWYEC